MATQVFPLPFNVPIVDPATGFPTPFFTNMIQQWLAEKAITDGQAQGAAVAGDAATSGITSAAQTVLGNKEAVAGAIEELTASQVLDLIGSTRGQILFRGAAGWSVLAPGTSGNFLKTNGAGADPAWAAAASGSGTSWTVSADSGAITGTLASLESGNLSTYNEVLIVFDSVTLSASDLRIVQVSTNGGASYDTAANYKSFDTAGIGPTSNAGFIGHSTASASARGCLIWIAGLQVNVPMKPAMTPNRGLPSAWYTGSSSAINKVKASGNAANMTGGRVYILAR